MKKLLILVFTLLVAPLAFAQQGVQQETLITRLLSDKPVKRSSGYGAVVTKFSSFNEKFAFLTGGYGGWFINDQFLIGLGGYGLSNRLHAPDLENRYPGERISWEMGYGGLDIEYTLHSKRLIHYSFNMLIGGGGISKQVRDKNTRWHDDEDDRYYNTSAFFVIEPGATIEMNVTKWFRIGVGASYRSIHGSNTAGISDSKMSAPSANVSFKFGGF